MRRRAAEGATQKSAEDEAEQRQKKKRKRRVRLPKGFDPANPGPMPNPERWLPKWQRSDFKKKRTRRKDKVCCPPLLHFWPTAACMLGQGSCVS